MRKNEIDELNAMITDAHFDVRTVTMGISLLDCVDSDLKNFCARVYDKITKSAENLVKTRENISKEFGVPIVNTRISITPISIVSAGIKDVDFVKVAKTLDSAAETVGVDFLGGFSALVQKGGTECDNRLIRSIPEALSETNLVCSSVNVGSTKTGINMDAVKLLGSVIKDLALRTNHHDSFGCAKLVVFCNAVDDNPFMAGAFHGVGERDAVINVGISGPGVVKRALEHVNGKDFETLCETIKRTAFKITRVGQFIAQEASRRLGVPFGIVDLSLAPTPAVGDSVGEVLMGMGLEQPGAPGTIAALAILNDNVKKGGVMASSYVGGLSGAFIPVSEDAAMFKAAEIKALTLEKLEAMTCVCSVGLDMVAIPGDTTSETISGILADEMAIGMINNKTTAVRILPIHGKSAGEEADFTMINELLGKAPIMPVNTFSCVDFIDRGGRIPAPIHSYKN
jgi:uncharacterized protein (UPF0210 family)